MLFSLKKYTSFVLLTFSVKFISEAADIKKI